MSCDGLEDGVEEETHGALQLDAVDRVDGLVLVEVNLRVREGADHTSVCVKVSVEADPRQLPANVALAVLPKANPREE